MKKVAGCPRRTWSFSSIANWKLLYRCAWSETVRAQLAGSDQGFRKLRSDLFPAFWWSGEALDYPQWVRGTAADVIGFSLHPQCLFYQVLQSTRPWCSAAVALKRQTLFFHLDDREDLPVGRFHNPVCCLSWFRSWATTRETMHQVIRMIESLHHTLQVQWVGAARISTPVYSRVWKWV